MAKKKVVKKKVVKKKVTPLGGYLLEKGVTQSLLGSFIHCRQSTKLSLEGWRKDVPKHALQFGSLYHYLLECYYGRTKPNLKKWIKDALKTGQSLQEAEMDIAKASALFESYKPYWKKKDIKKKWVEVEKVFDVDFEGYRLRGKTDGVYEDSKHLWLLETKTASSVSDDTLNKKLAIDFQNLFYVTAKSQELGKPIKGVLYNIIRKPSLKQRKDEEPDAFMQRIKEDITNRPETYFHRYEVVYSKRQQQEFRNELVIKLQMFENWINGYSKTVKNQAACVTRWNCSYLDACASGNMVGYNCDGKLFSELEE